MSSRMSLGSTTPSPAPTIRTSVLFALAAWQRQHGYGYAPKLMLFRKEQRRLTVFSYGHQCYLLEFSNEAPRLRAGKPWKQRAEVIRRKLTSYGWQFVSEINRQEVGNVH